MVDMEEMRDFMDKEQLTEFTVDAGPRHELPVDSSLNQIEQRLKNIYGNEKRPPSRKTILQALSDLAEKGNKKFHNPVISKEEAAYLYEQVIRQRYQTDWAKEKSSPTHPAFIHWEEVPLIEALTIAKAENREAVGEELAYLTLNKLIETHLSNYTPELEQSFTALQLLGNEYAQWCLIQKHQEQLTPRLNQIHALALTHDPATSLENMHLAFSALDSLISDLLVNSSKARSSPADSYTKHLNTLYDNLRSIREESYMPAEKESSKDDTTIHPKIIKFSLPEGHEILDPLQKGLCGPWWNMPPEEKASLRECYEQYLLYHFLQTKDAETVQTFLKNYHALSSYINGNESWEQIQLAIRKELQEYIRWIFNDVQSGNVVPPYTYSEYEGKTASSAFIANLTKYAHDQIRATVHHPLRLLLMVYYIKALNLLELRESTVALEGNFQAIQACLTLTTGAKLRVDDPAKSFDDILAPTLGAWMDQTERAIEVLKKEHPHLSLVTVTDVHDLTAFLEAYEESVPDFFSEGLLSKEYLLSCAESISSDTVPLLSKAVAVGEFLRASTQLVTADIAKSALAEIEERYKAQRPTYRNNENTLTTSSQQ